MGHSSALQIRPAWRGHFLGTGTRVLWRNVILQRPPVTTRLQIQELYIARERICSGKYEYYDNTFCVKEKRLKTYY